ncbi:MAG: hypothetical protein Q7T85_01570, partial [Nitrosomonas sp.]|nr:hypothetical protein [Nitrosomonas sp.]
MKTTVKYSVAVLSFALFSNADASIITIETGFSTAGPQIDAAAYKSLIDAAVASPSAGYGTTTVSIYDNISNHSL